MKKVIDFKDIVNLRKVAESLKGDLPHLPLLLELCICGMSRYSIAGIKIDDIKDNEIIAWKKRNNSLILKKLSSSQRSILEEYLRWRKKRYTLKNFLILAPKNTRAKNKNFYFLPVLPERVRSDIRMLAKEAGIECSLLEISNIHDAVARHLVSKGIDLKIIKKYYNLR